MDKRYDIICDPADLWTVWDREADEPAHLGLRPLTGLTKGEASIACALLNDVARRALSGKARPRRSKPKSVA
jgi:hypothetical protein